MAELVAELIREPAPVARADIDDDPGKGRAIEMQPDVRQLPGVVVDADSLGLAVRHQAYAGEARVPHAGDDHARGLRPRAAPIATDFNRRGSENRLAVPAPWRGGVGGMRRCAASHGANQRESDQGKKGSTLHPLSPLRPPKTPLPAARGSCVHPGSSPGQAFAGIELAGENARGLPVVSCGHSQITAPARSNPVSGLGANARGSLTSAAGVTPFAIGRYYFWQTLRANMSPNDLRRARS